MCGLKAERVMSSIDIVTSQHSISERQFRVIQDYNTLNVSKKVLRIILTWAAKEKHINEKRKGYKPSQVLRKVAVWNGLGGTSQSTSYSLGANQGKKDLHVSADFPSHVVWH